MYTTVFGGRATDDFGRAAAKQRPVKNLRAPSDLGRALLFLPARTAREATLESVLQIHKTSSCPETYSSPSSSPWLDVGAPPSMDGTPAGGAAFGAADFARPPEERLLAARPPPVLAALAAGFLAAGFFAAFRAGFLPADFLAAFLAVFLAVFPAAFFTVFVFFAGPFFALFLAAIP
jgi:hypothetical protein